MCGEDGGDGSMRLKDVHKFVSEWNEGVEITRCGERSSGRRVSLKSPQRMKGS